MDEQVKISDTVKDFIEAHLDDPELSISGIAKGLFLNYSYLCYCFRRDCASTINDYITMSKVFKNATGKSPGEYRAENKNAPREAAP